MNSISQTAGDSQLTKSVLYFHLELEGESGSGMLGGRVVPRIMTHRPRREQKAQWGKVACVKFEDFDLIIQSLQSQHYKV